MLSFVALRSGFETFGRFARPSRGKGGVSARQPMFDLWVVFFPRRFRRHADCILDGVPIGRPVANDGGALHPQKRRAAILGVVEALFEINIRAAREQISELPRYRRI